MTDTTPYDEIDPAMRNLCRALNAWPGIRTNHSCQGPIDDHHPWECTWEVGLEIDADALAAGLRSMKALIWACVFDFAEAGERDIDVTLRAKSPLLPHLSDEVLFFILIGRVGHPEELADALQTLYLPTLERVWRRADAR